MKKLDKNLATSKPRVLVLSWVLPKFHEQINSNHTQILARNRGKKGKIGNKNLSLNQTKAVKERKNIGQSHSWAKKQKFKAK